MKNNYKVGILVLLGAILLTLGIALLPKGAGSLSDKYKMEPFISCLIDKGAKMYGTDTCSYCIKQKREFGKYFKEINYINCVKDLNACKLADIQVTPTWTFEDGSRIEGYSPLPQFAEKAGCPLELK